MNTKNSIIILCSNIKLDKEYKNVLNYTEKEMLDLCSKNGITKRGYSFIRPDVNTLRVNFTYSECLNANYIAFQNPNYSNKWFFAFIEEVRYINEITTEVDFKVDAWSTWFPNINIRESFVIREHVDDDTIGKNTFPEGLETGEYINKYSTKNGMGTCHAVVALTEEFYKGDDPGKQGYHSQKINGIPTGLFYYVVGDFTSVSFIGVVTAWAETKKNPDVIQGIFMVPDSMTGYAAENDNNYWDYALDGTLKYAPFHKLDKVSSKAIEMGTKEIEKHYDDIDGYVPKNNKLFTYPYKVLVCDNNGGSAYEYRYEDFSDSVCKFKTYGDITFGCSIRTLPLNYKGINENNSEGINACKLPVGSYSTDPYINWLTQNGVNVGISLATSALTVVGGVGMAATGAGVVAGTTAAINGSLSIASTMNQIYQHSRVPSQVEGNINSGDVTYSSGNYDFTFYHRYIKKEYAKRIDDYFTRFGYKVSELKVPNITGRPVFNYIQIGEGEVLGDGSIPTDYLNEINRIAINGTTIWHNHENIGDYTLDNKKN